MDKYEKKYNEALERAKELLLGNEHSNTIRSYFEHIFPELRESEDERMIKWVIKVLDEGYKAFFEMDYSKEDVLSWLEKQKEQKTNIEICPHSIKSKSYKENGYPIEQKPVECSDCAKHLEGYISGRVDAEKKLLDEYGILIMPEGELRMKPHWKPSEEQMKALKETIDFAPETFKPKCLLESLYECLKKRT